MNIQPIDVLSLVHAITRPVIVVVAFIVFRRPLGERVKVLGQWAHKFSFGSLSLELAEVSEAKPRALDTEIRQLDAGLAPQNGASAISNVLRSCAAEFVKQTTGK